MIRRCIAVVGGFAFVWAVLSFTLMFDMTFGRVTQTVWLGESMIGGAFVGLALSLACAAWLRATKLSRDQRREDLSRLSLVRRHRVNRYRFEAHQALERQLAEELARTRSKPAAPFDPEPVVRPQTRSAPRAHVDQDVVVRFPARRRNFCRGS